MATRLEKNYRDEDFYKLFSQIYVDITINNKAPWLHEGTPERGVAYNPMSGIVFNGINSMILEMRGAQKGYKDSRWLSYDEIEKYGFKVKDRELATPIAFLNKYVPMVNVHPSSGERFTDKEQRSRYFFMYNVEQLKTFNLEHDGSFIIGKQFVEKKIINAIENSGTKNYLEISDKLFKEIEKKVPNEMRNLCIGITQYRMSQELHIPYKPILRQEQLAAFKTLKPTVETLMTSVYNCEVSKNRLFSPGKQLENDITRTVEKTHDQNKGLERD